MSDLSTPDWNAKILKALKANSRRFAKAPATKSSTKRADARATRARSRVKSPAPKKRDR